MSRLAGGGSQWFHFFGGRRLWNMRPVFIGVQIDSLVYFLRLYVKLALMVGITWAAAWCWMVHCAYTRHYLMVWVHCFKFGRVLLKSG